MTAQTNTKTIALTQGHETIVDAEDYEYLSKQKWFWHPKGYAAGKIKQRNVLMHRVIMKPPPLMQIDHINGNKLDNRKANLRFCTLTQNNMNRRSNHNVTSPFKGVHFNKSSGKWVAQINANKTRHHLGSFPSESDAANAYNEAAINLHKQFACTNKI